MVDISDLVFVNCDSENEEEVWKYFRGIDGIVVFRCKHNKNSTNTF